MLEIDGTTFTLVGDWDDDPSPSGDVLRLHPDQGRAYAPWSASTVALLQAMEAIDFAGKAVLDFGTGSGILAIAAALRGATVDVTEYIPIIRAAADANFAANDVTVGEDAGGHYDIILANVGEAEELKALAARCDLLLGTASTTKERISGGHGTKPVYKTRAQDIVRMLQTRGRTTELRQIDDTFAVVQG